MCEKDSDCPHPELGQVCLDFYWEGTMDGTTFSNGDGCYNWEAPVCPGDTFATINYNYANTQWSYYGQYTCKPGESAASALAAASAALLVTLSLM